MPHILQYVVHAEIHVPVQSHLKVNGLRNQVSHFLGEHAKH